MTGERVRELKEVDPARVVATPAALDLIERLRREHGDLLFHQSGGCCDGSAPMCYPQGDFMIGDGDVLLGEIGGAPFYIGAAQFDYWKHTQLVIDVVPGQGGAGPRPHPAFVREEPAFGRELRTPMGPGQRASARFDLGQII